MNSDFDRAAAVTRSMLGWGVVAGPFYVAFGLVLALTRDGFDLTRHSLSLLTLGDGGWMQVLNLVLTGAMAIVAGWGMRRAIRDRGRGASIAVMIAGAAIILAGVFRPDPMDGFPTEAEPVFSATGALHLAAGGIEFVALAVAAFVIAGFFASRDQRGRAAASRIAGVVIIATFLAGAALSRDVAGVALLWIAVLASFAWLLITSVWVYRAVPHPDAARRA